MEAVQRASEQWRAAVGNADRLWLCWNVNSRWCLLQQKLVTEAGWVPVVGWDPNCGEGPPPAVLPNAIAIDFNALLGLPALFMHVPLEFAFLWCRKLAFWHSDLLLDREQMRDAATRFEALQDGRLPRFTPTVGSRTSCGARATATSSFWAVPRVGQARTSSRKGAAGGAASTVTSTHRPIRQNVRGVKATTVSTASGSATGRSTAAARCRR